MSDYNQIELVNGDLEEQSLKTLEKIYERGFLPAEKKPYLSDLSKSRGIFLKTESGKAILDAASQIATLGLGFGASSMRGVWHWSEAWSNDRASLRVQELLVSYRDFLKRKLGWKKLKTFLCNSGSEANEIALGAAYERRRNPNQNKVLAFKGSFHGRMLVSLASTWNPVKREIFEWPSFKSVFVDYPEMKGDYETDVKVDQSWRELWSKAARSDFESLLPDCGKDELLKSEVNTLLQVREALMSNEVFAVLAEPMQCEGGDRYSSSRYHNGLANLCRALQVPIVYDEVQCGFAMGADFFWHTIFDLRDENSQVLEPDYVVCAKKAQVGMVLSHETIPFDQEYAVHSLVRGYLQGIALDQSYDRLVTLEKRVRDRLKDFVEKHKKAIHSPRARGMSFSFDFFDKDYVPKFIAARFHHGMLYYPAGTHTARFRLNLSFGEEELDLLFTQLDKALRQALGEEVPKEPIVYHESAIRDLYETMHEELLDLQFESLQTESECKIDDFLTRQRQHLVRFGTDLSLEIIDESNLESYKDRIERLQELVYEEARQTSYQEFENAIVRDKGFGVVLLQGEKLAGLSVCSVLAGSPLVSGVRRDPFFSDEKALYSLDITVHPDFVSRGLGRFLKFTQTGYALLSGFERIHGRNREFKAGAMIAINLSLGAFELQHLPEDYKDFEDHRGCFYYSLELPWRKGQIRLSEGVRAPWGMDNLDRDFLRDYQGYLLNKVCLSNFISPDFLSNTESFLSLLPDSMRHCFTTSSQSECVDKAVKSIWDTRKVQRLLTIQGSYFGEGSFLSRSLSGKQNFFPVDFLPFPHEPQEFLEQLTQNLQTSQYLGLFLEPIGQKSLLRIDPDCLKAILDVCRKYNTPVVFNDTGSLFGRYDGDHFLASARFEPDLGFSFMGGQMGIVYGQDSVYVEKPLALISTWDGDEFTYGCFTRAVQDFLKNKEESLELIQKFEEKFRKVLEGYPINTLNLQNGCGFVSGVLPAELTSMLEEVRPGLYRVLPSPAEMKRFVEEF